VLSRVHRDEHVSSGDCRKGAGDTISGCFPFQRGYTSLLFNKWNIKRARGSCSFFLLDDERCANEPIANSYFGF
jgi:hypothetical protein